MILYICTVRIKLCVIGIVISDNCCNFCCTLFAKVFKSGLVKVVFNEVIIKCIDVFICLSVTAVYFSAGST